MHIFMHTFHYLMFSLWHCKLHMQFWQRGAQLRQSPLQHPPVRFARGKLRLVGEVSPFNSEFTARGSLTRMQSGTPSKLAKGDFFMQFWQGGARLRQSPLQHPPVQFACGKLCLVGEVSPFDSEFTMRGLLTRMQSGTPSKSAEGDFFMQFWQGGARLRSPLQHLPVWFAHSKLRLVGEVFPFDSEFTSAYADAERDSLEVSRGRFFHAVLAGGCPTLAESPAALPVWFARGKLRLVGEVSPFNSKFTTRGSLTRMQSGTLSKSAKGDFFRGVIVHFLKNTCLRTMECLHCELKAFSDCAYIYA